MTRRFSSLVLLPAPVKPVPSQLVEILSARFAALGPARVPEDMALDEVFLIEIGDQTLAVETVDGPMPHAPLEPEVQPTRAWAGAADALSDHAAHLRIVGIDEPEDHAAARAQAAAVTVAAGVLGRMCKGLGTFYPQSGALLEENEALRAAHSIHSGVSPIEAWVSIYPLGPDEDGEAAPHGACTLGLEPLVGREIELAPLPIPRRKAHDRAYGAAWRALDGDDPFEDGQELRDAEDKVYATVRAVPEWLRKGVPAWVLVAPDAVVEPRRLRLKRGTDPVVLRTPVAPRPDPATAAPEPAEAASERHA